MSATLLLLASTWTAGADTPAVAAAQPPVVMQGQGGCCGNAPVAATPCGCGEPAPKQGLFAKLKARFAKAPAPAVVAYSVPCDACSQSAAAPAKAPRPNLLDKLRDRCGKHKGGPATCGCSCDCITGSAGPVYGAPIAPTTIPPVVTDPKKPPMEMPPKVTDTKKSGSDAKIPDPKVTEPKKIAPDPRPAEPKKTPIPVTEPKKGTVPEGLNIPALPQLPGNAPGANVTRPATITPVSGPKLNGANSPY